MNNSPGELKADTEAGSVSLAQRWRSQCRCVDIHTHVVPENFPPYLGSNLNVAWPSMASASGTDKNVMISGRVYRTVTQQCWDVPVRQADLTAQGLSLQVLSPMPELLSYWLPAGDGAVLARFMNESIAEMVARGAPQFLGLGTVPLQDIDAALRELDYVVNTLKLSGVELGSNVNGKAIGDPSFRPFFEAAARLNCAVFVHALKPAGLDRVVGPPQLEQLLAFPGEIGLAAASMLTGGTLAAVPKLRIAFSHGGGSLPTLLPRLQMGWRTVGAVKQTMSQAPAQLARQMYYDDLVYDSAALHNLIRVYGVEQLLVGSDYPFTIMDRDPLGSLEALALDETSRRLIASDNAFRWLGIP